MGGKVASLKKQPRKIVSNAFARTVASLRENMGVTWEDLCNRGVDISRSYLCDIENGRRRPAEEVIVKLAKVLGADPDYLTIISGIVPSWMLQKGITSEQAKKFAKIVKGNGDKK